jgi:predicted transcriptional regulator of viral defense system
MNTHIDVAVAAIAENSHGIFASHHLHELRVSNDERAWRLGVGRWIEVHQGVYRISGAPSSWEGDVLAACWAGGTRAVASHRSSAALHELPGGRDHPVEITCPRWRRAQHGGLIVHESTALTPDDITVVRSIPVTTVERTLFDLAAVCGARTVDLAIDNAMRRDLTDFEGLLALLQRVGKRGRRGTKKFRHLLAERDAAYAPTESEREQMLLRVLSEHGLPEPERIPLCCQVLVDVVLVRRAGWVVAAVAGRVLRSVWVREWLFRRAGLWGARPVTLTCSVVPACPPGPVVVAASATSRWCSASLIRRLSARTASFLVLPSASLRS